MKNILKINKRTLSWTILVLLAIFINSTLRVPVSSRYWYCPVCHGQTLWESDHPEALKILAKIEDWQNSGRSEEDIEALLQSEYGSSVLRSWGGPWLLGILGMYWLWRERT